MLYCAVDQEPNRDRVEARAIDPTACLEALLKSLHRDVCSCQALDHYDALVLLVP